VCGDNVKGEERGGVVAQGGEFLRGVLGRGNEVRGFCGVGGKVRA